MKDKIKEIGNLYTKGLKKGMDEVTIEMQQKRIKELEQINEEHRKLNGELREENKEWQMIFDGLSKRPYAHRYLEEKRKELGNDKIIALDSETIYKDYYDLRKKLERYKNMIDELKTYLENGIKDEKEKNIIKENLSTWQILEIILDKLKELKGE